MIERTYEGLTLDECMGGSDTLQGMDVGTLWNVIGALAERMEELEAVAEAAVKTWHVLNTYADDYWPLLPVMAWLETPLRAAGMLKEGE